MCAASLRQLHRAHHPFGGDQAQHDAVGEMHDQRRQHQRQHQRRQHRLQADRWPAGRRSRRAPAARSRTRRRRTATGRCAVPCPAWRRTARDSAQATASLPTSRPPARRARAATRAGWRPRSSIMPMEMKNRPSSTSRNGLMSSSTCSGIRFRRSACRRRRRPAPATGRPTRSARPGRA